MATNVEARNILQGLFNKWNDKSEDIGKYNFAESREPNHFIISPNAHGSKKITKTINGQQVFICSINKKYANRAEEVAYYLQENYDPNYVKEDYVDLIKRNHDFDFIKFRPWMEKKSNNKKKVKTPKAPMKWNKKGRLLFYGKDTNLTPYNLDVICSLHANYDNPFTFGDYVLQNLPRALPSAVFYLCENYEMIPDLSKEGKQIMDKR